MKRLLTIAAAAAAIAIAPSAVSAQTTGPSIALIHGIPGTTVDLVVDGTVVLDGFAPGSIVDITSFAGRTLNNVEVVEDTADDTGDTVIGPIATPDRIQIVPGLPKTRSGKIMRRILRQVAKGVYDDLGDISTLAEPAVVEQIVAGHREV